MLEMINGFISGILMPAVLFFGSAFCHIRYGGSLLRHPIRIFSSLCKKEELNKKDSPFKAVMLALAGTLGVGNITGVATAICAGGCGVVFWMWICALLSASLKYSEVVLAVKYRIKIKERYRGGAVYYIEKGIGNKTAASIFAVLCIITSFSLGNGIQVMAAADAFNTIFGINPFVISCMISVLCFAVIYRGVKSISDFTVRMVPLLSAVYCVISLYIIFSNIGMLPNILIQIFKNAFSFRAAGGGAAGYMINRALRFGVTRGLASNESGCGTAPYAHASADTDSPVKQGFWGIFEVYADTLFICTMTAFVILLCPEASAGYDGMELVLKSFGYFIGDISSYFLCFSVIFFSLASVICWSFYGTESIGYLSKKKIYAKAYIFLYCVVSATVPFIGSGSVWEIADICLCAMTLLNTICIIRLSGEVKLLGEISFKEVFSVRKQVSGLRGLPEDRTFGTSSK